MEYKEPELIITIEGSSIVSFKKDFDRLSNNEDRYCAWVSYTLPNAIELINRFYYYIKLYPESRLCLFIDSSNKIEPVLRLNYSSYYGIIMRDFGWQSMVVDYIMNNIDGLEDL